MYDHGYGAHPPEELPYPHHQERSTMIQGRYEDARSPQYDSPSFNHHNHCPPEGRHGSHYPPEERAPFWPHDALRPDARPHAYPPPFSSFHPSQHESFYPPPPRSPPHSAPYPPHYGPPHTASFGEHIASQQGHTHWHTHSFEEHRNSSSGFMHGSSFGELSGRPLVDTHAHHSFHQSPVPHHSSSFPHHPSSVEEDKPFISQRESVVPIEISSVADQPPADVELPKGQLVRVFCKSGRRFNLAVKDNRLLMVEADTEDEFQQWIRDDKYSIRVRDSYGQPAFMLINKGSKKALKHGKGNLQEVQLINYTPKIQDDDLFWTESQDFGEGFKTIRMASDTLFNLSVASGNKVENGSSIILDTWHKKDTQLWKVFPL